MRCERCGRENPEHLTFCEDCGYNLKAARRDAGAAPASRATPSGSGPSLQRPQAPPLRLGERQEAPVTRTDQGPLCSVCQTRNQAGHRFCIACGSPLPAAAPSPVTAAQPVAAAPAAPVAAPAPVAVAAPVVAAPVAAPALGAVAPPVAAPPIEAAPPMGPGHTARPAAPILGMAPPTSVTSTVLVPSAVASVPLPPAPAPTASMSTAIPDEPLPAAAPAARGNDAPTPLAVPSPLYRGATVPLASAGLETIDPASTAAPGVAALAPAAAPVGSTTVVLDRALTDEPRRPPSERTKKPTAPDGVAAMRMREQSDSLPPPHEPSLQALPLVSLAEPPVRAPEQQVCPRCRTVSEAGTPFCRVCGQSLSAGGAAGGAEPAPAPAPASAGAGPVTSPLGAPRPVLEVVTPKVATLGRLVQLAKDGSDGPSHAILSDTFDLGSREGEVTLDDDPYLSPRHARLLREGGHWYVVDLDSVNGVYRRVQGKRALSDGDLILLGQQVLRFEVVMDAEHALRPAVQHGVALFGTPQSPRLARLCQRTVEGVTRDVYHLSRPETSLGRETADIVFSDDPFLSRRHAVVSVDREAGTFAIEDQGSSNGTFVAIRGRERLAGGEVLRVGLHLFRVELAGGERGVHS